MDGISVLASAVFKEPSDTVAASTAKKLKPSPLPKLALTAMAIKEIRMNVSVTMRDDDVCTNIINEYSF